MESALGSIGLLTFVAEMLAPFLFCSSVPLGVTPGQQDANLARVAPEQCVLYVAWAGMGDPDPKSVNHAEQFLAEPEIVHLRAEAARRFSLLIESAAKMGGVESTTVREDTAFLCELFASRPCACFVTRYAPATGNSVEKALRLDGGLVMSLGEKGPRLAETFAHFERLAKDQIRKTEVDGFTETRLADDPVLHLCWTIRDKYLIVTCGDQSPKAIAQRMTEAEPSWFAAIGRDLPIERRATVLRMDFTAISSEEANAEKAADVDKDSAKEETNEAAKDEVADSFSVGEHIRALTIVTGLEGEHFVSRSLLEGDETLAAQLQLLKGKGLRPEDLASIPSDATLAAAAKIEPDQLLAGVLWLQKALTQPEAKEMQLTATPCNGNITTMPIGPGELAGAPATTSPLPAATSRAATPTTTAQPPAAYQLSPTPGNGANPPAAATFNPADASAPPVATTWPAQPCNTSPAVPFSGVQIVTTPTTSGPMPAVPMNAVPAAVAPTSLAPAGTLAARPMGVAAAPSGAAPTWDPYASQPVVATPPVWSLADFFRERLGLDGMLPGIVGGFSKGPAWDVNEVLCRQIAATLDNPWCIYSSPGEGSLVLTGITATVRVKDRKRLELLFDGLLAVMAVDASKLAPTDGSTTPPEAASIRKTRFADHDVYTLTQPKSPSISGFTWCLTDTHLVCSSSPQCIKAYLLRAADAKSLAQSPAVVEACGGDASPTILCYEDAREMFRLTYPIMQSVATGLGINNAVWPAGKDPMLLPAAPTIAKHLQPAISTLRATDKGVELTMRQSLPCGNLPSTLFAFLIAQLPTNIAAFSSPATLTVQPLTTTQPVVAAEPCLPLDSSQPATPFVATDAAQPAAPSPLVNKTSGECNLKDSSFENALRFTIGKDSQATCIFYRDTSSDRQVINANISVKNDQDKPLGFAYYVAFFDKAGELVGSASFNQETCSVAPHTTTTTANCLVPLPKDFMDDVVSYRVTFYEIAKTADKQEPAKTLAPAEAQSEANPR